MKYIRIIQLISMFMTPVVLHAQQAEYDSLMLNAKEMIDSSKTLNEAQALSLKFKTTASVHPGEWLPHYYAAFSDFWAHFWPQPKRSKAKLLLEASDEVRSGLSIQENAELYILLAYIEHMQGVLDPQVNYPKFEASRETLQHAEALDPGNPRIYLVRGQILFYTPESMGGGAKTAKPILLEAKQKFEDYTLKDEYSPDWGRADLDNLLRNFL